MPRRIVPAQPLTQGTHVPPVHSASIPPHSGSHQHIHPTVTTPSQRTTSRPVVIPISCNECRRRKIRCNRVQPCKNCSARDVQCTYPPRFRSIELHKLAPHAQTQNQEKHDVESVTVTLPLGPIPTSHPIPSGSSPTTTDSTEQSLPLDRIEAMNIEAMRKVEYYERKLQDLERKLQHSEDLISIFDSNGTSFQNHFGANSIQSLEYSLLGDTGRVGRLPGFAELANKGDTGKTKETKNRPLPTLIMDDEEGNLRLINTLVEKFFDRTKFSYFRELFSEDEVSTFVANHASITEGEHDEDMMVLIVILIDALKDGLLRPDRRVVTDTRLTVKGLVNYYFQVSKSQGTESVKFIKSQLLVMNYFYYIFAYEKAWKMMVSAVSNAYAHGIHIAQGPLWMKISFLEAILCISYSRPNLIHGLTKIAVSVEEDPLKEYELFNILRDRNMAFIEASVNGVQVRFQQVLQIDVRFDDYNSFLQSLFYTDTTTTRDPKFVLKVNALNDKIFFLLLISISQHIKLHYNYFEHDRYSDVKTLELIVRYTEIFEQFATTQLNNLRDMFPGLECHLYQFFLIFIKYLNFKMISGQSNSRNMFEVKSGNQDELSKLHMCQLRIQGVFDKHIATYCNANIINVVQIIRSVNIKEFKRLDVVEFGEKEDEDSRLLYATDGIRDVLEDEWTAIALKDISGLPAMYSLD